MKKKVDTVREAYDHVVKTDGKDHPYARHLATQLSKKKKAREKKESVNPVTLRVGYQDRS